MPRKKYVPSTDAEAAFVREALVVQRYSEKDGALRVRVKRNGVELAPDELAAMGCPAVTEPFVLPERGPHPARKVILAAMLPGVPLSVWSLAVATGAALLAFLVAGTFGAAVGPSGGGSTQALLFGTASVGLLVAAGVLVVSLVLTPVAAVVAGWLSLTAFLQYASVAAQWHPAEAYAKRHNLRLVQKYKLQRTLLPNGYFTGP